MPPTQSVEERIVDSIETALGAVSAGSAYNNAYPYIVRGGTSIPSKFPTLELGITSDAITESAYGDSGALSHRLTINVIGWAKSRSDIDRKLSEIKADVRVALDADFSRGGIAHDTAFVSSDRDRMDDIGAIRMVYVVTYRDERNDPAQEI